MQRTMVRDKQDDIQRPRHRPTGGSNRHEEPSIPEKIVQPPKSPLNKPSR